MCLVLQLHPNQLHHGHQRQATPHLVQEQRGCRGKMLRIIVDEEGKIAGKRQRKVNTDHDVYIYMPEKPDQFQPIISSTHQSIFNL